MSSVDKLISQIIEEVEVDKQKYVYAHPKHLQKMPEH